MKTYNFVLNQESFAIGLLQRMKIHCKVLSWDASFIGENEQKIEEENQIIRSFVAHVF
jgi:hypothetical protein